MSVRRVKAGTTDVSVTLRIVDSTDGTPETGVVFNTSGIDLWYRREGAAAVDITEVTLAALTTAHTDGGFLHINDGWYRLDLPDAACAAGVAGVQIGGTVTGMVVLAPYIELPVNTAEDVFTRVGAPAGASVSADIADVEGKVDDLETRLGTPSNLGGGATIAQNLADIEAQTDDIGAAGAGLTAVPWNAPTADGAHPTLGIIDQGTAQSASATGLVLRSAAAFADNTLIGASLFVFGSTQGYWQSRVITDNALSGDSVTVDTWTVTPSGTITYKIFGSPPGSATAPVPADLRKVMGNAFTGSTKPYDTSA